MQNPLLLVSYSKVNSPERPDNTLKGKEDSNATPALGKKLLSLC
jgi:hypothetical protein